MAMRYGRYGLSYLSLRLGLALTFLWIGADTFLHPAAWIGYVPETNVGFSREAALAASGVLDVAVGLLLLLQLMPKTAATLAVLKLTAIIAVHGLDPVLARDVGLLGAALALALWPRHYRRHWWRTKFSWFRRKDYGAEV